MPQTAIESVLVEAGYGGLYFIGIDTGSESCGWAIISSNDELCEHGAWNLRQNLSFEERLQELYHRACSFFQKNGFYAIAIGIEDAWIWPRNPQSGLRLAKTWGVIFASATRFGHLPMSISPKKAKKALTGNAAASKEEVMRFARALDPTIEQQDVADAISVAEATRMAVIEEAIRGAN